MVDAVAITDQLLVQEQVVILAHPLTIATWTCSFLSTILSQLYIKLSGLCRRMALSPAATTFRAVAARASLPCKEIRDFTYAPGTASKLKIGCALQRPSSTAITAMNIRAV